MKGESHMRHTEPLASSEHSATPTSRKTLTTLERTIALALLGMGLIYLFQSLLFWFVRGAVVLPFLLSALLALLAIGLILGRRRAGTRVGYACWPGPSRDNAGDPD